MKASKPIKVFWTKEIFDHAIILIILEELRLPYESNFVERKDLRILPWEDDVRLKQWSSFQVTAQSVCFALAAGFHIYQKNRLPDVSEHFIDDVPHLINKIDTHLENKLWLVGTKCTYVDLSFVVWNTQIPLLDKDLREKWAENDFFDFDKWQGAMIRRKSVKTVLGLMGIKDVKSDGKS